MLELLARNVSVHVHTYDSRLSSRAPILKTYENKEMLLASTDLIHGSGVNNEDQNRLE